MRALAAAIFVAALSLSGACARRAAEMHHKHNGTS
jgi:hypothetical protein